MAVVGKSLKLTFHGRVLDHLGIQMYQSPTAALAELISNAWDADAETVEITLPLVISGTSEIIVRDSGNGMTFEECQNRFLNVGYDCRAGNAVAKSGKDRPLLGRKGIGKFAGFGIASLIRIETVSRTTGERTIFELKLDALRGTQYIESAAPIEVDEYDSPNDSRKQDHGTILTLKNLALKRAPNIEQFLRSMSRRFLLIERVSDFKVTINDQALPVNADLENVEYSFPLNYVSGQIPNGLTIDEEGWGIEEISNGRKIKWRFVFYEETIKEDELRGISIFANGKLAQRPFLFNIVGGIGGQQGLEYLSGKVEADYIDSLPNDIIATERQRINWEHEDAIPLLEWGRKRVMDLCRLWQSKRAEAKVLEMEGQLEPFAARLASLQNSEQKTLRGALMKLAQISSLTTKQFRDLGEAILTSWEAGRLRELVREVSLAPEMSAESLIDLLVEANVLTALNTYEAVKTKLSIIEELRKLIERNEIENKVRDYIATNPWLISPAWETFKKEISLKKLVDKVVDDKGIKPETEWNRRIDLLMASGDTILLLEFMQPGKTIDRDHVSRFQYYVETVREYFVSNTIDGYRNCVGYLIASRLTRDGAVLRMIQDDKKNGRFYMDWDYLLAQSEKQYEEFILILKDRSPSDARLERL